MKKGILYEKIPKQAGLEVPHSRFKKGLSAKKLWVGTDQHKIMVGDRLTQNNRWGQT